MRYPTKGFGGGMATSRVMKKVGEGFGSQVVQILGASENRSKAYSTYASRGSQEATTEMGRMGPEAPSIPFSSACWAIR